MASLPVELLMAIVEDADEYSLPSLCLVCRALLPIAQSRLYRRVVIEVLPTDEVERLLYIDNEDNPYWDLSTILAHLPEDSRVETSTKPPLALLQSHRQLASLVLDVTIHWDLESGIADTVPCRLLRPFIDACPNIRGLKTIVGSCGFNDIVDYLFEDIGDSLQHLPQFTTTLGPGALTSLLNWPALQHLNLRYTDLFDLDLSHPTFPCPFHLRSYTESSTRHTQISSHLLHALLLPSRASLQCLSLAPRSFIALAHLIPTFVNLTTLRIDFADFPTGTIAYEAFLDGLGKITGPKRLTLSSLTTITTRSHIDGRLLASLPLQLKEIDLIDVSKTLDFRELLDRSSRPSLRQLRMSSRRLKFAYSYEIFRPTEAEVDRDESAREVLLGLAREGG